MVHYFEASEGVKGVFSYNCQGLLVGKLANEDLTKFGYDPTGTLEKITKPNGDELGFNFDLLGRLRNYMTDERESGFNYDGTKRLGDYETKSKDWRRYHWCRSQFLGYKDFENTYFIIPDMNSSTKIVIDANTSEIINRLEYDHLGYLRNKTTEPQVEILWESRSFINNLYIYCHLDLYSPNVGNSLLLISPSIIDKIITARINSYNILNKTNLNKSKLPQYYFSIRMRTMFRILALIKLSLEDTNKNGMGSDSGWNSDSTLFIIDPEMSETGSYRCCLAYEIDENLRPTGRCALWGECYGGVEQWY